MIFDEETLSKLEQLTLVANQVRAGVLKGERRSTKRGTALEFADYRNYTQGDDLRRLDWNVYARLERPFIKLFEEEEDLAVHLLIDASASMDWPVESPENKLRYALRLAAALGYIALAAGDQLNVTLSSSRQERPWGPFRSRQNGMNLFRFLESAQADGLTDVSMAMRNYSLRARRPGLIFFLSDLLAPGGFQNGLTALQARGYEVSIVHILSQDELDPRLEGDLNLVDVETGQQAEITLDASARAQYAENLNAWLAEIAAYCHGRNVHYIPVTTSTPWEKLILQTLRSQELIR